ncbi:MAG: RNA polymerase sigma factor [Acidimicrobiia bacterium]
MTQVLRQLDSGPSRVIDLTFNEEFPRLFDVARRTAIKRGASRSDADDIAQEALARCYSRWRKLHDTDYLDAWVIRTASNLVIDSWRKKDVTERLSARNVDSRDHETDQRLVLTAALSQLPRRQREVIVLRYIDDLHEEAVAEVLGCTVGTVRKAAQRGRETLREKLGDKDFECFRAPLVESSGSSGDANRAREHGRSIRTARHGAITAVVLVLVVGAVVFGWRMLGDGTRKPQPAATTTMPTTTAPSTTAPTTTMPSTTAPSASTTISGQGGAAPAGGASPSATPAQAAELSFTVDDGALHVGNNPVTFVLRNPGSTPLRLGTGSALCTLALKDTESGTLLYAFNSAPCSSLTNQDLAPGATLTLRHSVFTAVPFIPRDYSIAARFGTAAQSPEWSESSPQTIRFSG